MRPEFIDALFGFSSAMAMARIWLKDDLITQEEYDMLCKILTKKYGISLGSILVDMS